jgi:hypothetical protein
VTCDERVKAVAEFGFTTRQARFLVTVMLNSGVFLARQYCAHARITRGTKTHAFLRSLVSRRFASVYRAAHRRSLLYHVHGRPLYRAIGEPENRHRRPVTLSRAVERLIVLDAVVADSQLTWLATEQEKVEHFTKTALLSIDILPSLTFGRPPQAATRYFPDKLPVGYSASSDKRVFLYGVTSKNPIGFRTFLHRHARLLRSLAEWEIRLVVPPHLTEIAPDYEATAREELETSLAPTTAHDMGWYFEQRRRANAGAAVEDPARFEALRRTFQKQRDWAMYRTWQRDGSGRIYEATLPIVVSGAADQEGHVTRYTPSHNYLHLESLVGSA